MVGASCKKKKDDLVDPNLVSSGSAPTGWSVDPADGATSRDATPTISGSATQEGALVMIFEEASCASSSELARGAVSGGVFSISSFTLGSDGLKQFYFQMQDTVGNLTSCQTAPYSYTLDTTAPSSPTFASPTTPTNQNPPTLSISDCQGSDSYLVSIGATPPAADDSGWTSCAPSAAPTPTLSEGSNTLYLWGKDVAGNVSDPATTESVVLDQTAPAAPASFTMSSPANGATSNDTTPQISGTGAENGATVSLYDVAGCGGALIDSAVVSSGSFTLSSIAATGDGVKTYYYRIADALGNSTNCAATSLSYTLDETPPTSPSLVAATSPTNTTPATLTVNSCNDSGYFMLSATQPAASDPGWLACTGGAATTGALSAGSNTLRIWGKDIAGNVATSATTATIVYDTNPPNAATGWSLSSPSSGVTSNDATPVITGSSDEDGATVSIFTSSSCLGSPLSTGTVSSGTFTISAFTLATDGAQTFYYLITDTAGNSRSCATTALGYTLDTTPPSGTSVSINSGQPSTNFPVVIATLAATESVSNPVQMCVQEGTDCSICSYGAFTSNRQITLSSSTGTKTVSARFRDSLGNQSSCITDTILLGDLVVEPRYSAAPDWNDYVKLSDTTTACDGTESVATACIHGGEARKVATLMSSCSGLSMTDDLGVFDWTCVVESGMAVFTSAFKEGMGLRNLLTGFPDWAANSVTLTQSSNSASSEDDIWWGNPVDAAPNNSGGTLESLEDSGTVYAVTNSRATAGYNLNADKISLVTLNGATLSWNDTDIGSGSNCSTFDGEADVPDLRCIVSAGNQYFLWIEGDFDGGSVDPAEIGVQLAVSNHSKLWEVHAANMADAGVLLQSGANANIIRRMNVANNAITGLRLDSASGSNLILGLNAQNNGKYGLHVNASSGSNVFTGVVASANGLSSNSGGGVQVSSSSGSNRFWGVTAANNGSFGVQLVSSSSNVFSSVVTANQPLGLQVRSSANSNTFSQLVASANTTGVKLNSIVSNKFVGNLLGGNTTNCTVIGGTNPGLENSTCTVSGTGGSADYSAGSLSSATLRTGIGLASSFVGKTSDTGAYSAALDWFGFSSFFQTWGRDGSAFPNSDHQGRCSSGSCRGWDWSLASGASVIRDTSGDGVSTNDVPLSIACPSQVDGNAAVTPVGSSSSFLLNAIEVLGDGVGDDDSLCESSESCVYAPNFGSYQGHGTLSSCSFSDGTVTGVSMQYYGTNGR